MKVRPIAAAVALLFSVVIAGCGDSGLTSENFSKVKNGMTQSEVTSLLGSPTTETSMGGVTNMGWSSDKGEAIVVFENGKVTAKRSEGL